MKKTLNLVDLNTPIDLSKRVILITGATGHIGRPLALEAAKRGASLILVAQNTRRLEALYDEIMHAKGPEPALHPIDLFRCSPKEAQELAKGISDLFGHLDGLVHLAGVMEGLTPVEHYAPQLWQKMLHIHLTVPFLITQSLIPLMDNRPDPSIIFTTGDQSTQGEAYWSAFSAAKCGLRGFAQSLQEELSTNTPIRVNCINPLKIKGPFRSRLFPGENPDILPAISDLIPYYVYLLSGLSRDLSGQHIHPVYPAYA